MLRQSQVYIRVLLLYFYSFVECKIITKIYKLLQFLRNNSRINGFVCDKNTQLYKPEMAILEQIEDKSSIANYYALETFSTYFAIYLITYSYIVKGNHIYSVRHFFLCPLLIWLLRFSFPLSPLSAEILLSRLSETFGVLLSSNFQKSHDSSRVEASFGADDSWQVINRFL